jgi:hypothetical protein
LTVRVCNGPETDRWEVDRAPDRFEPHSLDQLLGILGGERGADRLYVQLYRAMPGATVRGGEISQPPPSVLDVLGAASKMGEATPTKGATLAERVVETGRVVSGCETKIVTILPYRSP